MDERIAAAMTDPAVASDTRLLGDFAAWHCRGVHRDATRSRLVSDGVTCGVYGRRVPVVCAECAELLRYAESRRALCPKDPKPFCSACDTHCYRPAMRQRVRDVMRYAGPRSLLTRHAVAGVRHLIEGRKAAAAIRRRQEAARKETS